VGEAATASNATHAFSWSAGRIYDLGTLGGDFSTALAINDQGVIVGSSLPSGGATLHGFVWTSGHMTELPMLPGSDQLGSTEPNDINERGQIVGTSRGKAVIWQSGKVQALAALGNGVSIAQGINESGQVVGYVTLEGIQTRAVLWENGQVRDLGTLGGSFSQAAGINERGQIVGSSETPDGSVHAFLWKSGSMQDLGVLEGDLSTIAYSINNAGIIVGQGVQQSGVSHAQQWHRANAVDLGASAAFAVNELGDSVGIDFTSNRVVVWFR
jgi:probable HAF family extracellular repeat protein